LSAVTTLEDLLYARIKTLNERVWEGRASRSLVKEWLSNFNDDPDGDPNERLHVLFLLSRFMYFGEFEVRQLLQALYRDLFRYPIIRDARVAAGDTKDAAQLHQVFTQALSNTRFLGVGNPSESGVHLLYFFRQENNISRKQFIDTFQIFARDLGARQTKLADSTVDRYVFIDDFCGSGQQAQEYSRRVVDEIKQVASDEGRSVRISYYCLCARDVGLAAARTASFDDVESVVTLDDSFRCFDITSRYFRNCPPELDQDFARTVVEKYGGQVLPSAPLGYQDGQLIVGFHHNTPDNSLPVFWCEGQPHYRWRPLFKRYRKVY
jgi:hypothetical protein